MPESPIDWTEYPLSKCHYGQSIDNGCVVYKIAILEASEPTSSVDESWKSDHFEHYSENGGESVAAVLFILRPLNGWGFIEQIDVKDSGKEICEIDDAVVELKRIAELTHCAHANFWEDEIIVER